MSSSSRIVMRVFPGGMGTTAPRRPFEKSYCLRMSALPLVTASLGSGGPACREDADVVSPDRPGHDHESLAVIGPQRQVALLVRVRSLTVAAQGSSRAPTAS